MDRTVVITGGGRGIGRAIAELAAERGFSVLVLDVDGHTAQEVEAAIHGRGGRAKGVGCDIRNRASVEEALQVGRRELGSLYAVVNNAGTDRMAVFADSKPEDWQHIIDVNLMGTLNVTQVALGDIRQVGGRVVSISSDAARVGSTGEAVYSATKAGILGFTKTLAREVARDGVTVNAVCPGPTDTALLETVRSGPKGDKIVAAMTRAVPLGRIARPRDIAAAVLFFLSDDAAYITGQTLSVSGGLTMA